MIKKPFKTYTGGKNGHGVYQAIINQIPPHEVFITAFAGNCGVLANKLPAPVGNIAIDKDAGVSQKWSMQPGVTAFNGDAPGLLAGLISLFDVAGSTTFVFLDPPYLEEVRSSKKAYYKHEMLDIASHENLVRSVSQINARRSSVCVMLVHYPCKFYDDALKDWRKLDIVGRSRKGNTIERLYMNYSEPTALHDVRYFGNNFRQRELLSKAAKNLRKKFNSWTPIEKQYFLHKLNEPQITSPAVSTAVFIGQ